MDAFLPHDNEAQPAEGAPSCPVVSTAAPAGPQLSEDSFRRVVEWAPSAMVMIDRDGIMVLVNAQTERMFNYDRTALIGQSVEMLVPERFRNHHVAYRPRFFAETPLPSLNARAKLDQNQARRNKNYIQEPTRRN